MTYSPWADAAERYPDVVIHRCDLAPAQGAWVSSERVILLDRELDARGRRCALAHELVHMDRTHRPQGGWFGRRQELEADKIAAHRLLDDVESIAEALCIHPLDPEMVAEHLGVTVPVLRRRLSALTDAERDRIQARIDREERGA